MSRDANAQLKNQVSDQNITIGQLGSRISTLVDRIVVLESDLNKFKKEVADDMSNVLKLVKKAGERHLEGR